MSTLDRNFNKITATPASDKAGTAKYPPPFSIRFTFEERARLDADRGSLPLSAHIREKLFGDGVTPRKRPGNSPVGDSEALGRVLGALGASRLSSNLNQLAKAANTGSLPVSPEVEAELMVACQEVQELRAETRRDLLDPSEVMRLEDNVLIFWRKLTKFPIKAKGAKYYELRMFKGLYDKWR